jgi:4-carboxymuconolactone decarboxylase
MQRLAPVDAANLSEDQKKVYDKIADGPRGGVRGPFAVLLHSPSVADPVQALGAHLRYGGVLPGRLRELAILATARHWSARYEWYAHVPISVKEGLDPVIIGAIAERRMPEFQGLDEATVFAFCSEVLDNGRVGDETYAEAVELFGAEGVVELVAVAGYYSLLSMVLNTFDVKLPGDTGVFERF